MNKKGIFTSIGIPIAVFLSIVLFVGFVGNIADNKIVKDKYSMGDDVLSDEEEYQQGIEFIKQKDWLRAESSLSNAKLLDYKDGSVLYYYVDAKLDEKEGNFFLANYTCKEYIPDYYYGEMADEILTFKNEIAIKSEQQLEEESIKATEKKKEDLAAHRIWIGMSKEEAEISQGKPNDINRSVGSWGTHEQWCYPGGVYLYFENGRLTSWQD